MKRLVFISGWPRLVPGLDCPAWRGVMRPGVACPRPQRKRRGRTRIQRDLQRDLAEREQEQTDGQEGWFATRMFVCTCVHVCACAMFVLTGRSICVFGCGCTGVRPRRPQWGCSVCGWLRAEQCKLCMQRGERGSGVLSDSGQRPARGVAWRGRGSRAVGQHRACRMCNVQGRRHHGLTLLAPSPPPPLPCCDAAC